jgi:SAM-dependent methyltransferase
MIDDVLVPLLRCPCPKHRRLQASIGVEQLRCTASGCPQYRVGFESVGGQPVLVDFSQGGVDRERFLIEASGPRIDQRVSALRRNFRRLASGENRVGPTSARRLLEALAYIDAKPTILIIGGGEVGAGVDVLRAAAGVRTIAFDVYRSEETSFIADAHAIPFADSSVDAVWIQAVLEHVIDPHTVVAEIWRVLKPGGLIYAETPFMQQVHMGPADFMRFTESGHRWLMRGFERIDSGVVGGPGTTLLWAIRYLTAGVFRSWKIATLVAMLFSWVRLFDRIIPEAFQIDGACGTFFFGCKQGKPLTVEELFPYYRGALR